MNEKIKELRHNTQEAQDYFTKKLAYTLDPVELKNFMEKDGVKVIDIRLKADYDIGHIPGAISIPKEELDQRLQELSKNEINIIYCYNQQCHLGYSACLILAEYGYPTMLLEGGFKVWMEDFRFATTNK